VKTIWFEIREHSIVGEPLLLRGLSALNNGNYRAELYAETKRTNQQNKYFHVLFTLLQKALYDFGYEDITTMEKAKDFIKDLFLSYEVENRMNGVKYKVKRGTSELSKDEGIEFIDSTIKFAAEELGFYVPTQEEYQANPAKWNLSALKI
jgi:hypothetical protein